MNDLLQKLEAIYIRFIEVGTLIVDPDIITDMKRYVKLTKEYKDLEELVVVYKEYKALIENLESSKELLKDETDPEMREMAKMEIDELETRRPILEEDIKMMLIPKDPEDEKNAILHQIKIDCYRTFRPFDLKFLNAEVESGQNKLYNLLKVYATILDPNVGYTQGMNFIAAVILMHVPNEVLACQIFTKVLQKDDWAKMYLSSTPKLFDLSAHIFSWIEKELPEMYEHLTKNEIYLEVLLASPLMTIFANLVSFSEATHIINMFILDGEQFIVDLVMNIYKNMMPEVLKITDQFEIQAYMSKDIFDDAL